MPALEAGLKTHALDRIMFPPDPVTNAPAIVSVAGSVFPPLRDHLIVGPMVQIAWGAAQLVTIELAIIFEFPTPLKVFIMGKLKEASLRACRPGRFQASRFSPQRRRGDASPLG
jgi:hypothetical protein